VKSVYGNAEFIGPLHFTATFHYSFPQLTMGLALLIVIDNIPFLYRAGGPVAFLASGLYLVGMLSSAAFGVLSNVLPSNTAPDLSLTVCNAAAAEHGLIVGLWGFIPGMALATVYSVLVYRHFTGKVE